MTRSITTILLSPAIALMNRMSFSRKFALLWLIPLVAICVTLYSLYINLHQVVSSSHEELEGLALIKPLAQTVQLVQKHRGLSSAVLSRIDNFSQVRAAIAQDTESAFSTFEAGLADSARRIESWKNITEHWKRIHASGLKWTRMDNFSAHTQLINELLLYETVIADDYGLTADPDLDAFYLAHTTGIELLEALEQLGQMRAYGTGILGAKQASNQQITDMEILIAKQTDALERLKVGIEKSARYNLGMHDAIFATYSNIEKSSQLVIANVDSDILNRRFSISPNDFFDITTAAIDKAYEQLYQSLLPATERLIQTRIQRTESELHATVGVAFLLLLLVAYFMAATYYSTLGSIKILSKSVSSFVRGNMNDRVHLETHDELTLIGDSFNIMADELTELIAEQQEVSQYSRSLIEASLDPLVTISAEGKITDANTATEHVTGLDRSNLIGSDFADYFTDPKKAREGYQLVFSQGFVTDYPLALRHVSGKVTDVLYNASLYRDGNGNVLGAFAAARDITERKHMEQQITEREQLFHAIFNQAPSAVELIDPETLRFVDANPAACLMLGYTHEEFLRLRLTDTQANLDEKALVAAIRQVDASGGAMFENQHRTKNGDILDVEINSRMLNLPGKRLLVGVWRDITEHKRAEENLRITASVFDNTQEAILITDANNAITDVNPAFTNITGYSRDEVLGLNPKLLSSGRHDKAFYDSMWQSLNQKKAWRGEIWNRRKSGGIYAELLSISVICDDDGKVQRYVGVFSDISHLKEHEAELSRIAHYDALTGIPNRVLLADRMKQAIAQTEREQNMMTVCYLDLDGFKLINDTMGHDAGDHVLIEVSRRIENTVRGGDTVARLGGDEFVVLLLGQEKGEECVATLERLLAAIAQPITVKGKPLTVGASIGVSIYPLDDEDPDTLLRHADQAMYVAKQSGKNRFHIYDPALDLRARDRNELLKNIRYGLELDSVVTR